MIEYQGLKFRLDEKKGHDYRLYILEEYLHKFNKPKNRKRPPSQWRAAQNADRMGNWDDIHFTMQKNAATIALNEKFQFPHVTFKGRLNDANAEKKVYFDGSHRIAYINFDPLNITNKKELAICRKAIRMAMQEHNWIQTLACTDTSKSSDNL